MDPVLVVSKSDLQKNDGLGPRLSQLCDHVKEFDDACHYSPSKGNLVAFMSVLLKYHIDYELQYQQ